MSPVLVNLDCGVDIKVGWINVDKYALDGVDVVHDITVLPLPFQDDIVDVIELNSVLEHIPIQNQIGLVNDCYRVLKKDGVLVIRVPHFTGFHAFNDIEHIKPYTSHSFDSFVAGRQPHSMADYQHHNKFRGVQTKIVFGKGIQIWNYLVQWLVNLNDFMHDVYEQSFLSTFPAEGVHIWLKK